MSNSESKDYTKVLRQVGHSSSENRQQGALICLSIHKPN